MRRARILGETGSAGSCYHLMTRAIEGRMIFDSKGKERFRQLLERHAEMAGIEVFTWCCMGNHFHLLVEVPNAEEGRAKLEDEEIVRRIGLVCSKERAKGVRDQLMLLKEQSPEMGYPEYRECLLARMFDVSVFMKELKQSYTLWCNRRVRGRGHCGRITIRVCC